MGVLDLLFPKYCVSCKKMGSCLCTNCFSKISFDVSETCLICDQLSLNGVTHKKCKSRFVLDGACASVRYNRHVQKLLSTLVYNPFLSDVKTILLDLFYEGIIQKEFVIHLYAQTPRKLLFVPVSKTNVIQTEILARGLVSRFEGEYGKLFQKDGVLSVKGVHLSSARVQNTVILLVDCVLKTGSPFLEAARVLKKKGAQEVWGIALSG